MRKIVSYILISLGLFVIGLAIYQEASTLYNQRKLIEEYDKYVEALKKIEISELEAEESYRNSILSESNINTKTNLLDSSVPERDNIESDNENNQETVVDTSEDTEQDLSNIYEGKQIGGLLEIPKINVTAAILEGTEISILKYAVGHYTEFGTVGQPGNYVLLGHRNNMKAHFFRDLDQLESGDEVKISVGDKTYRYLVYESFVVKAEEVWVLEQTEESIITMITCTPIGVYTDRLIVRGKLMNDIV